MHDYKPMYTLIEKNLSLSLYMYPKKPNEKKQISKVPYSSAVGSLMYAMMCTRLDICYVVGLVSRFQYNLALKHWMIIKRILRYLKGTSDYVMCYQGKDLRLAGYTDADWGGDLDHHNSTSRYTYSC